MMMSAQQWNDGIHPVLGSLVWHNRRHLCMAPSLLTDWNIPGRVCNQYLVGLTAVSLTAVLQNNVSGRRLLPYGTSGATSSNLPDIWNIDVACMCAQ